MAEISVPGTRRDNEGVVAKPLLSDQYQPLCGVNARNRLHKHGGIGLSVKNRADRSRDRIGRQRSRGHLIEQRLEQMIVVPIYQRDIDWRSSEGTCRRQPSEPAAND